LLEILGRRSNADSAVELDVTGVVTEGVRKAERLEGNIEGRRGVRDVNVLQMIINYSPFYHAMDRSCDVFGGGWWRAGLTSWLEQQVP